MDKITNNIWDPGVQPMCTHGSAGIRNTVRKYIGHFKELEG